MTETAHQLNGPSSPSGKFIDSINPDDPEYIRQLQRPAVVKEDVKQMEDRRRVSIVLNSEAFREELEQIVHEHMKAGHHPASLALQQITELLMPHSSYRSNNTGFKASPVIPILDIRGMESLGYSRQEKILRCKLASCYRLIDIFGWSHGIFNHITARINQEQEHFLLNPFGLLFSEMTASSLVKVDMQGEIVDTGSTCMGINKAGFMLHSAIHQARPDIRCIIHLHTPHAVAVSAMKCGLLPLSQESLICGTISYHEYNGIIVDQDEREKLARSLGPANKVMFLRNHGIVACGETVEEAYHFAFNVMKACDTQINALPAGLDNLVLVDEESQKKTFAIAGQSGGGGVDTSGRKWKTGELEFEALMRMMDNSGFRTGYIYRNPLIKQEKDHTNSDIEIPPTSSSFTYVYDGEVDRSKYVSPLRTALERQKQQQYKAGWLTSPNTYKKQEIDEIGTTHPKKITKWVPENSESTKSVNVKIEKANQFAPQGENPKEFRDKQKQIRKDYYEERVHAGPQSKVLEGSTWEDAQKMKDGNLSSASDSVVMIGAASKGIIRRDHQHNAIVYKSLYSPNPFENVSEDELAKYKEKVEGKLIEADSEDTEPAPDGRLISTEERMQQIRSDGVDLKTEAEAGRNKRLSTSNQAVPRGSRDDIHGSIPTVTVTPVSAATSPQIISVQRTESEKPPRTPEMIQELQRRNLQRSKSERKYGEKRDDEKLGSPAKSDTLRSTDSASGGETLDDRSSKEGSPTKENPSPTKKGKKKNIFRIRSFNKKKKEIKE